MLSLSTGKGAEREEKEGTVLTNFVFPYQMEKASVVSDLGSCSVLFCLVS